MSYLRNVLPMERRYVLEWYLAGAMAARTGDEMCLVALPLAALAATGSASAGSALLAALTGAAALGGPVVGVLLDRSVRPGRLLAAALALYATSLGLVLASLGRVPVLVTVLIAAFAGLVGPVLSGGWTAQLPRVVRAGRLPRAVTLDAVTFPAAGLAGPALAWTAAKMLGAPAGVLVSLCLIVPALLSALMLLPVEGAGGVGGADRAGDVGAVGGAGREGGAGQPDPLIRVEVGARAEPVAREVRAARASVVAGLVTGPAAGFRVLVRVPALGRATASSVVSSVGQGLWVACAPPLGERALGAAYGGAVLLSCAAASALAATALPARRARSPRPETVTRHAPLVLAAGLVLAATGRPVAVLLAALVVGLAEGPQLAALFAIRHRDAPEGLRGRIFTLGASLKITGFALGAGIAGPLAGHSLATALLTAAGVQILATVPVSGGPARSWGTAPDAHRPR